MNNNDIIRQLRYTFAFTDEKMMYLFSSGGKEVTRAVVSDWLKKDDNPEQKSLHDIDMAIFLNGFINDRRGKREGEQAKPEKNLNNNIILRKLKIALNLKDVDIIQIMDLADMRISKPELSALFRKPDHKHFRQCMDQFLRNFLHGLQIRYKQPDKK